MAAELAAEQDRSGNAGLRYGRSGGALAGARRYAERLPGTLPAGSSWGKPYDAVSDRSIAQLGSVRLNVCWGGWEALSDRKRAWCSSTSPDNFLGPRTASAAGATHRSSPRKPSSS